MINKKQFLTPIIHSPVRVNYSSGLQLHNLCLVVDAPYVVYTTKTEVANYYLTRCSRGCSTNSLVIH